MPAGTGKTGLSEHKVDLTSLTESRNEAGPATENAVDVEHNEHGGVMVSKEELAAAFSMLDVEGSGTVTMTNLKKRLGVFFPDLTPKEYRFMMNNKKELTLTDLHDMLDENDITNFDPVEEAFKLYDTEGDGHIHKNRLKDIFEAYGLDDMTKEDVDILAKAADIDGDGKISLSDFRSMMGGIDRILETHHVQDNGSTQKEGHKAASNKT